MSLPILRRIDKSDKESIAQAIEDGFDYVEDLLTYELNLPSFTVHIRRGRDSDIRASIQIALKELRHSRLYADLRIPREMAETVYKERVRHAFETAEVFVACAASTIVGFVALRSRSEDTDSAKRNADESASADSEIELIVVDSDYQRCGIGRQLVDACIDACCENGFDTLKVKTQRRNYRARSFYEKLGFSRTKIEKDYHKHEDFIDGA